MDLSIERRGKEFSEGLTGIGDRIRENLEAQRQR